MPYYHAELAPPRPDGLTQVNIHFAEPAAGNDLIVPAALAAIAALELKGGRGILFHGPASIPVAMALAHAVAHLYQFAACFDPKLARYVVAISHAATPRPGDLLE